MVHAYSRRKRQLFDFGLNEASVYTNMIDAQAGTLMDIGSDTLKDEQFENLAEDIVKIAAKLRKRIRQLERS